MGAPSSLLALLTYIPLLVERSRSQGKQIFKVNFEVRSHITFGDFYVVFQHMFFFVCVCVSFNIKNIDIQKLLDMILK